MNVVDVAKEVIQTEIESLAFMSGRIDEAFSFAVGAILNSSGRTVICGMGKSGLIGKKIAASFASTGTPSFFMHPGEAFHGDLGMVKPEDVFIAISNSGETDEVLKLLPFLRDNGNFVIAITGNVHSTLSTNAQCHLDIAVPREACKLQLAPTSSTTATLVMGDALTVALMEKRQFQSEHFARFHPGGSLGRKLLTRVKDLMHSKNLPVCTSDASLKEAITVMTHGRMGVVLIQEKDQLLGIFTDGDLRRAMLKDSVGMIDKKMSELMTPKPKTINENVMIVEAEEQMLRDKITLLVVTNDDNELAGILEIYDR
jgi:arabinose-5-phosphate isomerase